MFYPSPILSFPTGIFSNGDIFPTFIFQRAYFFYRDLRSPRRVYFPTVIFNRDRSQLQTTTPTSKPVTNKPNEELEMGVSGEQNKVPNLEIYGFRESITEGRAENSSRCLFLESRTEGTMLAMEFRESRGENEMKREKEIG